MLNIVSVMVCFTISGQTFNQPATGRWTKDLPDSMILNMMSQVDTARLHEMVLHLQNYETRYAYMPEADSAAEWVYRKLDSLPNLNVVKQNFPLPYGDSGINVIATLSGSIYPDEYIILTSHYDAISDDTLHAPGANDNATGTAAVIEAARIMSQYSFDRSIIFACFGAEEIGLVGSGYYARLANENNMKIVGCISIDCGGYRKPGQPYQTSIMHSDESDYLADFFKETCDIYLPALTAVKGKYWGWSDSYAFVLNGHQGIWNWENRQYCAPKNHTIWDRIGSNVNDIFNLALFVQSDIAGVGRLANKEPFPLNLKAEAEDQKILINWRPLYNADHYIVYKDSLFLANSSDTCYIDSNLVNGIYYSYQVSAVYADSSQSEYSSPVRLKARPPLTLPFFDDFENDDLFWDLESSWGFEINGYNGGNCLSDSPYNNYPRQVSYNAALAPLNLENCPLQEISFMTRYSFENGYDGCIPVIYYDYIDQTTWYTGNQSTWTPKKISLSKYMGKKNVRLFFVLYSDMITEFNGIRIDDFTISEPSGIKETLTGIEKYRIYPNPFTDKTTIEYQIDHKGPVRLEIYNYLGQRICQLKNEVQNEGNYTMIWDASHLPKGVYIVRLFTKGQTGVVKLSLIE